MPKCFLAFYRLVVNLPGLHSTPSERWGRLPQAFQLASQDAESIG